MTIQSLSSNFISNISMVEVEGNSLQKTITEAISLVREGGTVQENLISRIDSYRIEIAVTGPEIFKMIADAVREAKHEVLIQTFAWEGIRTEAVRLLREALEEVAKEKKAADDNRSLKVYVLIDERGRSAELAFNGRIGRKWPATPESIGLIHEPGVVEVSVGVYRHNSVAGTHAKTVVIDNKVLIITGANFQNSNFGHLPAHDAAFALKGSIAAGAREDFEYMWSLRTNSKITDDLPNAPEPAEEIAHNESIAILTTRKAQKIPRAVFSNPQNAAFHAVLGNANKIIRIATPNLNAPFVVNDLAEFINCRNGIVQLLLGKGFNDRRESLLGGTNQYTVDSLVGQIAEEKRRQLDIRWFSLDGKQPVVGNVAGASHLKVMFADDTVTIFGNANLDCISTDHLHEVNVLIMDEEFTARATEVLFTNEFARGVVALPTEGFMSNFLEKTGITGFKDKLADKQVMKILDSIDAGSNFRTIDLSRPEGWIFNPGQYVEVRSGSLTGKAWKRPAVLAIASGIGDTTIQITARQSINLLHSNHLMSKKIGHTLELTGPIGTCFPMHLLDAETPLVLIGGGSGLTVIRSIMRSVEKEQPVQLIYSAKTSEDLLYPEDIEDWRSRGHYVGLTQENSEGFGHERVTDRLRSIELSINALYFICGPESLIRDCMAILKEKGVPETQIYGSFPRDARSGGPVFRADHPISTVFL